MERENDTCASGRVERMEDVHIKKAVHEQDGIM